MVLACPSPVLVDGEDEYEVEKNLPVHWKGYGDEDMSWEPVENVHITHLIMAFHQRYPDKTGKRPLSSAKGQIITQISGIQPPGHAVGELIYLPDEENKIPIGNHSAQYAEIYAYTHALKESMLVEGPVLIVTESAYIARSTVQDLSVWCSNSFLTTRHKSLQHFALWKQIDAYLQRKPDIEVVHEPAHRKLGSSPHTVGNQLADTLAQSVSQRYSVNVVTRSQKHTLSLNLDAELHACMDKTRPNPPGYPTKYSYRLEGVHCIVTIDDKNLIIPPVKEREKLALEAHAGLGQAHLGRDNVLTTLKQKYWWPNMRKTVVHVIGNCKQWLLVNRTNHSVVPFIEKSIPNVPFELLCIDHIGPMPPSHGYKYVLICVDATRFTLYPVRSATSNTTISSLTSLASIGKPRTIHSDGGPAFIAKETQNWAIIFGYFWEISAPNHPQSSGVVERKNAEVKRLLTKLLVARPTQWYPLIPIVKMGINNVPNVTYGKTPFEMLYGVPCNTSFTDNHISAPGRVEQLALFEEIRESFSRPTTHRTPPPSAWVPTVGQFVQERVQTIRPLRPRWKKPVKIVTILNPRTFIKENNQPTEKSKH
ncbi:LOW QUALITY PROTEIN: uncharacterized protein RCH25_052862 [Pelodytes ibericus]